MVVGPQGRAARSDGPPLMGRPMSVWPTVRRAGSTAARGSVRSAGGRRGRPCGCHRARAARPDAAANGADGRSGAGPAGGRGPRLRAREGRRPGRLGQDPGAHRAPPPPRRRPGLRARRDPCRGLQQAGPAGDGGAHHVASGPGCRPSTPSATPCWRGPGVEHPACSTSARCASSSSGSFPRRRGGPTPIPSARTWRRCRWCASAYGTRRRSRTSATTSLASRPRSGPSASGSRTAVRSTSTSRSTAPPSSCS